MVMRSIKIKFSIRIISMVLKTAQPHRQMGNLHVKLPKTLYGGDVGRSVGGESVRGGSVDTGTVGGSVGNGSFGGGSVGGGFVGNGLVGTAAGPISGGSVLELSSGSLPKDAEGAAELRVEVGIEPAIGMIACDLIARANTDRWKV